MDVAKCRRLKERLSAQPGPWVASVSEFFEGNDDMAAIGCNLHPHPGLPTFHRVLSTVAGRGDVESVYVWIEDLNPTEDYWPFSDKVCVVGTVPVDDLAAALAPLKPDLVGRADLADYPQFLPEVARSSILVAWWD